MLVVQLFTTFIHSEFLSSFSQVIIVIMSDSKTRALRSNTNAELLGELQLAAANPSVPVPTVLGGGLPAPGPVVAAIPAVPAAPIESDTKMDLLMNMLASANASRASELNSILNRMESLQEASTRASRVSLLAQEALKTVNIQLHQTQASLEGSTSKLYWTPFTN